jgi:hypothetical protein
VACSWQGGQIGKTHHPCSALFCEAEHVMFPSASTSVSVPGSQPSWSQVLEDEEWVLGLDWGDLESSSEDEEVEDGEDGGFLDIAVSLQSSAGGLIGYEVMGEESIKQGK